MEGALEVIIEGDWKFFKRIARANGYSDVFYTDSELLIKDFDSRGKLSGDRKRKRTITKRTLPVRTLLSN